MNPLPFNQMRSVLEKINLNTVNGCVTTELCRDHPISVTASEQLLPLV